MTNEPTAAAPPRFFEQVVLVSEDGSKTIIERRYSDGAVEYWSVMNIGWQAGAQKGAAQVPFKIKLDGEEPRRDDGETYLRCCRELAFANFESALRAAEPDAKAQVTAKFQQHEQREKSKIILAGAMPPIPVQ